MKKINKVTALILVFTFLMTCLAVPALAVSGNIPDDVIAMSSQIAVEIEQEGIILLKNEDGSLPLEGKKVNVFGAASVVPLLGGAGSGAITTHNPVYFLIPCKDLTKQISFFSLFTKMLLVKKEIDHFSSMREIFI